jgi:transmembrane sensor
VNRIKQLILQSLRGENNPEEQEELEAWLNASEDNRALFERMSSPAWMEGAIATMDAVHEEEGWERLQANTQDPFPAGAPNRRTLIRFPGWAGWAAAAALVLFLGAAAYWWSRQSPETIAIRQLQDIPPGSSHARLTLANGQTIVLDTGANGSLAFQGNSRIKKAGGQIVYQEKGTATGETLYNKVSTPRGGQYKIRLQDGTDIWLNAASSITYPVAFNGHDRKVTVTGEAYFEIAPDRKKPFIVQVNNTEVRVLGTRFNINAYAEEGSIKTTLLEGGINVFCGADNHTLLQPGEQAQTKGAAITVIKDVDLEQVIAWKNGFFSFDHADLQAVMRQLERWYDIDVLYEGRVPDIKLKGELDRQANLSDVLRYFSKLQLRYKRVGRVLTIEGN